MEYVKLSNGIMMPKLGFGVYQIPKEETKRCVLEALEVGYRHIDTAQVYRNEEEVGDALLETNVAREEIFLTTKVWISNYGYEKTRKSIMESLKKLKTNYIDLVLIHQPFGDYYAAYRALEDLYKEGIIKSIGVSNFVPFRFVDLSLYTEIKPHVNQIEINPITQKYYELEVMEKYQIQAQAWAPFGQGKNNMFENETLSSIGKKYGKTVAQVILRWLLQRNIVALAKTVNKDRMQQNFDIFDFNLNDGDMKTIETLNTNKTLFSDHDTVESVEKFSGYKL